MKLKYCPDRDLLKRLVNNGLDDTELDETEQHVHGPNKGVRSRKVESAPDPFIS